MISLSGLRLRELSLANQHLLAVVILAVMQLVDRLHRVVALTLGRKVEFVVA